MSEFTNKVAVVTGAASGMGRAVARQFARRGVQVVIADVARAGGEALEKEILAAGQKGMFIQTDVTSEEQVEKLVSAAVERYGRLDYAANMAGVPQGGGIFCSKAARDTTMAVNVTGTFQCVVAEARVMKRLGGGSIVNVSSVGGVQGSADAPYYVAAKHAILGFTKSAALELAAARIRVNAICPGLTRSAMTESYYGDKLESISAYVPIGRLGEPDDQANAVIWLCSTEASFVTGASFHIDGGQTAGVPAALGASDSYLEN